MSDNICHPKHYNQGGVECIDAIKAATVGKTGIEAFCVGNAIKYLWRYEEKNGLEDVKKARFYIERLIEELEPDIVKTDEEKQMDCLSCRYDECDEAEYPCCSCRKAHSPASPDYNKYELMWNKKL